MNDIFTFTFRILNCRNKVPRQGFLPADWMSTLHPKYGHLTNRGSYTDAINSIAAKGYKKY